MPTSPRLQPVPRTVTGRALLPLAVLLPAAAQALDASWTTSTWRLAANLLAPALMLGAMGVAARPGARRGLSLAALALWLAGQVEPLLQRPGETLLVVLGLGATAWWTWNAPSLLDERTRPGALRRSVSWALAAALLISLQRQIGPVDAVLLCLIPLSCLPALRRWLGRPSTAEWQRRSLLAVVLGCAAAAVLNVVAGLRADPWVIPMLAAAWILDRSRPVHATPERWWSPLIETPARLMVATFALLALAGTLLLSIPPSSTRPLALIDTAFTAVSAVCVTGLVVLSTPGDFSGLGQVVLLLLIQAGGLGIMTFSTAALATLGRRLSLRHEAAVAGLLSDDDQGVLFRSLRRVLVLTFGCELAGAVLLTTSFALRGSPLPSALWQGLFTSISAFCNAGFALWDDSLVRYRAAPEVLHTVAALIVIGGLSPVVVVALPRLVRGQHERVATRLAALTSLVLLVVGTALYAAFEWSHSLAGLSLGDRLSNAWFQSVTLRTAGFNSVDLTRTRDVTQLFMDVWMFIGGSPGGTAGGVKTTTVAILLLALRGTWQGRWEAQAFGRRLSQRTVYKAAAIATAGILCALLGLGALLLTQDLGLDRALFEVLSALGTVGLSLGATAQLDDVGKIIIMVCMFVGRVGPLTLFVLMAGSGREQPWQLPEEDVAVG